MFASDSEMPGQPKSFYWLLALISAGLAIAALTLPQLFPSSYASLQVGQVANEDIHAPRTTTYESRVYTEQAREMAAQAVSPIYSSPDPKIARNQLELLRITLTFITSVRDDGYATADQKMADLVSLEYVHLSQEAIKQLLELSEPRWQAVEQEAIVVLEETMRNSIRADNLDTIQRGLPAMVSLSLAQDQAAMVAELASSFVAPNSEFSSIMTEDARKKARDAITPVSRSYMAGEIVVQNGHVLTEADIEALQMLGLSQGSFSWIDVASASALVLLVLGFLVFYLPHNPSLFKDRRGLAIIALLFLTFLFGARLLTSGHTVLPYVFPLTAYSMTVALLFGVEPAIFTTLPLAVLAAYGQANALDLTLYYLISGLLGMLTLHNARRVMMFFTAGAVAAISGLIVLFIYRLSLPNADLIGMASLSAAALLNGFASAALTLILQFFLAQFLGLTTPLQLMEISRPDHPLLQLILRTAPGTYQHSLQVANLAEQAAERINADAMLTRIGALYHDIGKALHPAFFIENQMPGSHNPHDDLDYVTSASIIIRHVTDGLDLARKHRLPKRIQDFIQEHHGTLLTRYMYVNAVMAAKGDESKVNIAQFRYPGPRPRSRETAILMLADSSEAVIRASQPKDEAQLHKIIKEVVDSRLAAGQLADTNLTLQDIEKIIDSFTVTLRGLYHLRLEYPSLEQPTPVSAGSEPTVPASHLHVNTRSDIPQPKV